MVGLKLEGDYLLKMLRLHGANRGSNKSIGDEFLSLNVDKVDFIVCFTDYEFLYLR